MKKFVDLFNSSIDNLMADSPTIERENFRKRLNLEIYIYMHLLLLTDLSASVSRALLFLEFVYYL